MTDAADRILADLEASWTPLMESIEQLAEPGSLERATSAGWPAKEMLSHVAFWAEAVEGYVTLAIRLQSELPAGWQFGSGYVPDLQKPWPHFEEHNAREAAWGRDHSTAEVLDRLHRAHSSLVRFLTTITDEEEAANEQYFREIPGHFREHTRELESLLPK